MQGASPGLVYVDYLESDGQRGFQHACQMGLESIVAATCAKWQPDDDRIRDDWQTEACQYRIEFALHMEPARFLIVWVH
jgi:hypothetical protein